MKIKILKVGKLKCNCYILEKNDKVLIIDPGDEVNRIIKTVDNKTVLGLIVTHHHSDHDGGVNQLINKYNTKLYDRYNLLEGINKIDNFTFEVIYTPGHKEDLITIYFKEEKIMFCGDFIFKNSIGRYDLPGGNLSDMLESIDKIKKYNSNITIYPGHGEKTTLRYEINNNIFFNNYL